MDEVTLLDIDISLFVGVSMLGGGGGEAEKQASKSRLDQKRKLTTTPPLLRLGTKTWLDNVPVMGE